MVVEIKSGSGGGGIPQSPSQLYQAQDIPEKPTWTELTLALNSLPSPATLPAGSKAVAGPVFLETQSRGEAGLQGTENFSPSGASGPE